LGYPSIHGSPIQHPTCIEHVWLRTRLLCAHKTRAHKAPHHESHLWRGGFPHSDIPGSKLVCQLPGAFRRLPRPSSPVIAKASTTCTYSLDPITLSALASRLRATGLFQRLVAHATSPFVSRQRVDTIIKPSRIHPDLLKDRCAFTSSKFLKNSRLSWQWSVFSSQ
jgi:hypothetical protein